MVEGAICPNCTAPISNTSVRARAPICPKCGVTITIIDGKLGFISPYRVLDPSTSRKLAEANLAVFREQLRNYRGMQGDCKEKLEWSLEQYAEFHKMLLQPPVLLEIQKTYWVDCFVGVIAIIIGILGVFWTSPWVSSHVWVVGSDGWMYDMETGSKLPFHPGTNIVVDQIYHLRWDRVGHWHRGFWSAGYFPDWALLWWILCLCFILCVFFGLVYLVPFLKAVQANGDRPRENTRRTKEYEKDMVAAFRKAKSAKEITDFQLGDQIRELEGHIRTVEKNEAEVLQYLAMIR